MSRRGDFAKDVGYDSVRSGYFPGRIRSLESRQRVLWYGAEVEERSRAALGYCLGGPRMVVSSPSLNIENCSLIRASRHIMTGIGAYFYIVWGIWLRHCLNGRQDEFEMKWPRTVTSLPVVVRRRTQANGSTEKKPNGKTVKCCNGSY